MSLATTGSLAMQQWSMNQWRQKLVRVVESQTSPHKYCITVYMSTGYSWDCAAY